MATTRLEGGGEVVLPSSLLSPTRDWPQKAKRSWVARFCLVLVAVGAVVCIAPYTVLTALFEPFFYRAGSMAQGLTGSVNWTRVIYNVGYGLLGSVLCSYAVTRLRRRERAPSLRLSDAFACFASLSLLDPFLSTIGSLGLHNRWWPLYLFSAFFLVVMCAGERHAWGLIYLVLFAIGVQCIYAIAFYFLGIQQFHGARFGNRTGGTFNSPNALYPLCLLALPLSLALSQASSAREWRYSWYSLACLSTCALLLTFTRGAWMAVLAPLVYFALSPRSPFASYRFWRVLSIGCGAVLLLGVLFLRTRGNLMGGYSDSSFWGRIYIWKVATQAVKDRPVFGSGVSSYALRQAQFMTSRLQQFRPDNVEAKQLYLNVAVELGLVGLALLLWVGWGVFTVYRASAAPLFTSTTKLLDLGIFCAVLSLAVAGLMDTPLLNSDRLPPTLAFLVLLASFCVVNRSAVTAVDDQGLV